MLRFAKSAPYIPDPQPSRPVLGAAERRQAAARPPEAAPQHCKPWTDGQALGWILAYGFLSPITIHSDGVRITVDGLDQLAAETQQERIVDQFAADHFGIGSGYTLRTPPGYGSLLLPPPAAPSQPPVLEVVSGFLESDWYPRQLFVVFRVPPAGNSVTLDHGSPLARVVVAPYQSSLSAEPLDAAALAELDDELARYLAEEQTTDSRWTAAGGTQFTHLYRQWSARRRRED